MCVNRALNHLHPVHFMTADELDTSDSRDLDLAGTIRPGLDILANEIVIALKKRTRFPQNLPIYEVGLVMGDSGHSLLEHSLGSIERSHAELGRYTFATQEAFTDVSGVVPIIKREPPRSPIRSMTTRVGPRLLDFYRGWVADACPAGDDSSTYGETVTADVAALLNIMERVNLGKPVAESKFRDHRDVMIASGGDRDTLLKYIVRADREQAVLQMADRLANRYELPAGSVRAVFAFMIETTVDIEIDYLRQRIS